MPSQNRKGISFQVSIIRCKLAISFRQIIRVLLQRSVVADPSLHQEFAMALVKARGEAKAQDVLALQNLGRNQQNLWPNLKNEVGYKK